MQPPQPQQAPKKKSKLGIGCGVIAAVVILIAIISMANGSKSNTGTIASTSSTANTSTQQQSTQHFKVGQTVTVGNTWQIVVSNVRTDPGGQYDTLKSGDTYLAIDMSFKNISSQEAQLFGTADWTLRDASGQSYDSSYDSNITAAEPEGKVEAGDPAKGTLVYEVPASMKQFTLAFENNSFESGQTIWDITA